MATRTLKIEESTAKKIYKTADSEMKTLLEESFGKDFFSQKITDRIKTFDDVLNELGLDYDEVVPLRNPRTKEQKSINAFAKIRKISQALNESLTPDFLNQNQQKYYLWFERKSSGWSVYCDYAYGCLSYVGFGFHFKSSELAQHAGKYFLDIFIDYLPE